MVILLQVTKLTKSTGLQKYLQNKLNSLGSPPTKTGYFDF